MARRRILDLVVMLGFVATLCRTPILAGPPARPADVKKAAPTPPDPKVLAALNSAAVALVKEAQDAFKEPIPKLRDKADYFTEKPLEGLTPEIILMGLERSQNGDPRIDAYVKWQFLSGLPGPFPDDLVPRAIAAYRRAPEPINHPGLDRNKLTSALYRVGMMKKDKIDDVNKSFFEAVDRVATDNQTILRYRKDLYGRLPVAGDSLLAGLDDIFARARHGISSPDFWDTVSGSVQSWGLTAEGRQRDAVLQSLERLQKLVKDTNFKPFIKVTWSDDAKNAGMHWQDQMVVEDTKIQGVIDGIRNASKLMGGAGFKDQKK